MNKEDLELYEKFKDVIIISSDVHDAMRTQGDYMYECLHGSKVVCDPCLPKNTLMKLSEEFKEKMSQGKAVELERRLRDVQALFEGNSEESIK